MLADRKYVQPCLLGLLRDLHDRVDPLASFDVSPDCQVLNLLAGQRFSGRRRGGLQ